MQLPLIMVMQFAEGLSDGQATDVLRGHIDWKYELNLEIRYFGFDQTILSEFRARLVKGQAEHLF